MKSATPNKPNKGSYVVLQNWMIEKLKLSGLELIVYAIIYGFSQNGINCFTSTTKYLTFWTGKTKETCLKILKSLRNKKLIARKKKHVSQVGAKPAYFLCDYWATITRYPEDAQETILNNWSKFSTALFPQADD